MLDFAAIDFETANQARSSVCSIGLVVVRGGEQVDSFYALIRPEPNYYCYWNLVAHNCRFDQGCLKAVCRVDQMDYPDYTFLDTLTAARRALPHLDNHQLHTVAAACGYQLEQHHHALSDAEACAAIAKLLL